MERYDYLRFKYNTKIGTEIKDFLPIIGNEIPNKLLTLFDTTVAGHGITAAGDGSSAADYTKSYHGKSCYKILLNDTEVRTVTYTPASALNLKELSNSENNFAQISRIAKYGNEEDTFYLILNVNADDEAGCVITVWNGDTKNANSSSQGPVSITEPDKRILCWNKFQWQMDNATDFTYNAGFADADWENITKIEIEVTSGGNGNQIYMQNLWCALPRYSATVTDAYYTNIIEGNSIFVSWLFGSDANNGETRTAPVKTIEKAISLLSSPLVNIVILDSEVYKPVALDGSYIGIKQALGEAGKVIADYLETPSISSKGGLLNENRIGAREYYRTNFYYDHIIAAGTKYTVGTGGTYATIALALAAAASGDCIEILDSETYDETIVINKNITIQAAQGQKPIWKYTGGNTTLNTATYNVNIFNIILQGRGINGEARIITGATGNINIFDCTLTGIGTSAGNADAIKNNQTGTNTIKIENCLFVDNGANFTAVDSPAGTSGNVYIINCAGYLGTTADGYFLKALRANATNPANHYVYFNQILGGNDKALSYAVYTADTDTAAQFTNIYFHMNEYNNRIYISGANAIKQKVYCYGNYLRDAYNVETNGLYLVRKTASNANTYFEFKYNLIDNIILGISIGISGRILYTEPTANDYFIYNTFKDCIQNEYSSVIFATTPTDRIGDNFFYNCYKCYSFSVSGDIYNCVFIDCAEAVRINAAAPATVNVYNSLFDNSFVSATGGAVINYDEDYGGYIGASYVSDPVNYKFSWPAFSPIENKPSNYGAFMLNNRFIYPASGNNTEFEFINFIGAPNACMIATAANIQTIKYCGFTGAGFGINPVSGLIHSYNCFYENNSVCMRIATATITSICNFKNNICDGNNTGLSLLSGADIDYNTIINGDYGITSKFTGFYAIEEYLKDYLTISNSILANNIAYDYYFDFAVTNCIILNSFYALRGENNIETAPNLTDNYFPATRYEGFELVSNAYLADSAGTGHIGARNENHILAALTSDNYTLISNPDHWAEFWNSINLQEIHNVIGIYSAYSDADVKEIIVTWDEPGKYSKINAEQKSVMEYIYQTYWIIGISIDEGATYTYYKVIKSNPLQLEQWKYYYDTLPWGNCALKFTELPGFDIDDYEVDTWA